MRVLFNSESQAMRYGKYAEADADSGEFILDNKEDSALDDYSVATLIEIGDSNNIKLKKGKKTEVIENLFDGLKGLDLPKMDTKPESAIVAEIVSTGVADGKDDDEMLIEIVQAGVAFKSAGRLFNRAMEEGGHRISAKQRKEQARKFLVGAEFEPESWGDVEDMCERLIEEIGADTNTQKALSAIRAYAKEFEIEIPKPPVRKAGGFKVKVEAAVLGDPLNFTKDDLAELAKDRKNPDSTVDRIWPQVQFAQKAAKRAIELQGQKEEAA